MWRGRLVVGGWSPEARRGEEARPREGRRVAGGAEKEPPRPRRSLLGVLGGGARVGRRSVGSWSVAGAAWALLVWWWGSWRGARALDRGLSWASVRGWAWVGSWGKREGGPHWDAGMAAGFHLQDSCWLGGARVWGCAAVHTIALLLWDCWMEGRWEVRQVDSAVVRERNRARLGLLLWSAIGRRLRVGGVVGGHVCRWRWKCVWGGVVCFGWRACACMWRWHTPPLQQHESTQERRLCPWVALRATQQARDAGIQQRYVGTTKLRTTQRHEPASQSSSPSLMVQKVFNESCSIRLFSGTTLGAIAPLAWD